MITVSTVVFALVSLAAAQASWSQCGGQGWTGATYCDSGNTCTYSNQWYSQCIPNSSSSSASAPAPTSNSGFVTRAGNGFVLNGKPFYFAGTNAYWANTISSGDLNSLFSQMNNAGLKVLRIFGWDDYVGYKSTALQNWSGNTNTPNANGFAAQIDPIVNAANAAGIKLVIPMLGNWGPSINVYIQQILGSSATHDSFFSNSGTINAYKKYVNFFVNRYKNSPAIFAWELMNEPRCGGDDGRAQSSACTSSPAIITNWVQVMSSYIKSIDSNHMVTVGDEGWFQPSAGYSTPDHGTNGIDWIANLKISSIDYGTVHLYPDSWGQTLDWGNTWIANHATAGNSVGKPFVLEEFGTTQTGPRYSTVQGWLQTAVNNLYGGTQYWQFVSSFPSGYNSPNDGNGISTTESTFSVVKASAATQNGFSGGGVRQWATCGGSGWNGPTKCASPYSCVYQNSGWSRCQ